MTWCGRVICYRSCLPSTLTILGMGTVFAALLLYQHYTTSGHTGPHTVCGMQWSLLQLSIVIIYYREQSGSVSPVSSSNTSPDGGSAPSWLSPPGRSRCHLLRETDDRNGFISALRRLCNVITLMWFILAFRHADHQTLLLLTRHRHKHQTSQPDNNLKPNESNILSCSLQQGKGKSEATGKKSVTRCKSSEQSHHLHITSSRVGNYKYFTPRSQRCWENSDQAVMTSQLKEGLVTWSQGEDCVEQCSN